MTARGHGTFPEAPIGRLTRLDGLRGVLAVYVMLGHAAPFIRWPPGVGPFIEAVVGHGMAAVDLFFALSGLVIVQSMARFEGRAAPFFAARARRLLPIYLVVLAASIPILTAGSPFALLPWLHPGDAAHQIWEVGLPHPLAAHIALHLALIQGALPRAMLPDAEFSLLGPAWSLSTEWQFYALIALLMTRIGNDRRGLARLTVIFLALALAGRAYAGLAPPSWQFGRAFLPNQAAYFALGIAAARLWRGSDGTRLFLVVLAVAMGLGLSHSTGSGAIGKALPPLTWALAIVAQRAPANRLIRPFARVLGHPVLLWLGAISYPLYLANEPVQRTLALLFGGADPAQFALLWGGLALAVPIGLAALLHHAVERRFMRQRRRSLQAAAPAAAP